jgi:hypothetical protein
MLRAPVRTALLAVALGALVLPAAGAAQEGERDFLFRTPRATLGLRVGYALPTASSEIFDFSNEQLTLERGDYASATLGGQLGIRVTPRVDVAVDLGYAKSRRPSEFRDWVDIDDLPIQQVTEFRRVPLTAGLKYYLADRGRSIGRFAWIPNAWAPFVGAGAGWVWYEFTQDGDFLDEAACIEDPDTGCGIFSDRYVSDGHAPTMHVFGGADWTLSPTFFLTAEGRYTWAKADMSQDFVGFDRMDLSGFQATAGISVRF